LKPKEFFFVLAGLTVVILGAGGYGFYWGLGFIRAQSNSLAAEYAVQQVAAAQITSLTNLGARYQKQIVPVTQEMDDALPRQKNQTEILAQVERVAAANSLNLSGVSMPSPGGLPSSVSQTIQAGDVLALPINFSVVGPYSELQSFTSQIENLNRFTNITSLIVQGQGSGNVQYTFSLDAYIKP
jgi:Tfp pilus assembly protein PilO